MREFFHGWRRKAGCVTLVMACVIGGMWLRSSAVCDMAFFYVGDHSYFAYSVNNQFRLCSWKSEPGSESFGWDLGVKVTNEMQKQLDQQEEVTFEESVLILPYWSFAVSLTLLSTYLILWKPRTRTKHDA